MSYHFIIPLKLKHNSIDVANVQVNAVVHGKCDRCHQVFKMAVNGRFTADKKVKVVLFYAETKSVVATQRCFRAHFGTRWAPCKQTIYRLSLGTILQPMRINSVPDVKCFSKKKKSVMCTINGVTFLGPTL